MRQWPSSFRMIEADSCDEEGRPESWKVVSPQGKVFFRQKDEGVVKQWLMDHGYEGVPGDVRLYGVSVEPLDLPEFEAFLATWGLSSGDPF